MAEGTISFRKSIEEDVALIHELESPNFDGYEYRGVDTSLSAFRRHILAGTTFDINVGPCEHWTILLDGETIGWANTFRAVDFYRQESSGLRAFLDLRVTGALDWVLRPEVRGRGVGTRVLRAIAGELVFGRDPTLTILSNTTRADNVASRRASEKAGLREVGAWSDEDGDFVVYAIHRDEFLGLGERDVLRRSWDDASTCGSYDKTAFCCLPVVKRELVLSLGYTPEQWDGEGDEPSICDLGWEKLPLEKQLAAKQLGYTREKWNGNDLTDWDFDDLPDSKQKEVLIIGFTPEQWDDSDLSEPSACDISWRELPPEKRTAAENLGYTRATWEASSSDSSSDSS